MKIDKYPMLDGSTIKKSHAVHDVFYNNFSFNDEIDNKPYPFSLTLHPAEVAAGLSSKNDDESVEYVFNNNGFRCDNFKKNHDGIHILFAGCSETEGVGGNLNSCWAYMLYEEIIKYNKISGYFNIGKSGFGWQKIISNCLVYFDKVGVPDYLFIMLPDVNRFFNWRESIGSWTYDQNHDLDFQTHQKNIIDMVLSWKLFLKFCKEKNIKLLFSTFDMFNNSYILEAQMDDFIVFNYSDKILKKIIDEEIIYNKNNKDKKEIFLEKRDGHQGYGKHLLWKNIFIDKIKDNRYENLVIP
jgi:hypothetical protein